MNIIATSIVVVLLLAGCDREPTLDVSGKWCFFHGGSFTLVQDGKNVSGTGYLVRDYLPTAASDAHVPITAHGKIQRELILLTLESGTNTLKDVEFLPSISPKGNQRFLKCSRHLGLSLIPEGVDFFKHEILKPELAELSKRATANAGENSPVATIFVAMREGKYSEQFGPYTFPKLGNTNVPELLGYALHTNLLASLPVNMVSSIHKFSCAEGMVALWLIEGIRVGGRFPSLVPVCYDKNKSVSADAVFYAEADQDAVAQAYQSWWDGTRGTSMKTDPLDGTLLSWSGGRRSLQ